MIVEQLRRCLIFLQHLKKIDFFCGILRELLDGLNDTRHVAAIEIGADEDRYCLGFAGTLVCNGGSGGGDIRQQHCEASATHGGAEPVAQSSKGTH